MVLVQGASCRVFWAGTSHILGSTHGVFVLVHSELPRNMANKFPIPAGSTYETLHVLRLCSFCWRGGGGGGYRRTLYRISGRGGGQFPDASMFPLKCSTSPFGIISEFPSWPIEEI